MGWGVVGWGVVGCSGVGWGGVGWGGVGWAGVRCGAVRCGAVGWGGIGGAGVAWGGAAASLDPKPHTTPSKGPKCLEGPLHIWSGFGAAGAGNFFCFSICWGVNFRFYRMCHVSRGIQIFMQNLKPI